MNAVARPAALLATLTAFAALPLAAQSDDSYASPGSDSYAGSASSDDSRESYSYVRALEGRASLASYGSGPGEEATLNQILQQGDRLRVERGARLEVYLADRNLVRVGGDSDLALTRVAFSADRDDRTTRLDLDRGEIVLVVTEDALGDELPEIQTASARIYINEPGTYRIRSDEDAYTEVVVRSGYAELLTESGSTVVRSGEEAWTSGDRQQPVEIANAGPRDALERWGEELTEGAQYARERVQYVEPELSYAAAPLADAGSWVNVDSSWYWRPRVSAGWRPYWQGRWCWSPTGLTWVSYEPWGWVPYHYGSWCNLPGYGWAWRPGSVYSPAWVYWYASDSWTGWCPIGYYTGYYGSYWNFGFRSGIYGWCGGSWSFFNSWSFCNTRRICDRRWGGNWNTADAVARESGNQEPNGILTTDTGGVPRDAWDRPGDLVRTLERKGRAARRGGDLPVVTDFVARKKDLPPTVAAAIRPDPAERPGRRLGSPLDPSSLGNGGSPGRGRSDVAREERPGWRGGPKSGVAPSGRDDHRTDERGGVGRGNAPDLRGGVRGGGRPDAVPNAGAGGRGVANGHERRLEAPAPTPPDRQGWKSGTGLPVAPRALPPAGTRWQQADPDRGNAAGGGNRTATPRDNGRPREVAPPARGPSVDSRGHSRPSEPPAHGNSAPPDPRGADPRSASPRGNVTSPRYGYPARELGVDPVLPPSRGRGYAPPSRSGEPVERVIGGMRRESSAPSRPAPPGGWSRPAPGSSPGYGAAPRSAPAVRSAPSAPSAPRAMPPGRSGNYSAPRSPSSSPRATPAPPSGSHGAGQGGGQKATRAPSSSSSSNSSSQSSPPPDEKHGHASD